MRRLLERGDEGRAGAHGVAAAKRGLIDTRPAAVQLLDASLGRLRIAPPARAKRRGLDGLPHSQDRKPAGRAVLARRALRGSSAGVFCMYTLPVRISYDPAKNERNIRHRGLSFDSVADFSFETAVYAVDRRKDYGETRFVAVGMLAERRHVPCFTEEPDGIRVISFRKANAREVKRHAKVQNDG